MTAGLLGMLVASGARFVVADGRLRVQAPPKVLTGATVEALLAAKPLLLETLRARVAFVDFETRAAVSLEELGGRLYAQHPSLEVLCMVALLPGSGEVVWWPGDPVPPPLDRAAAEGVPFVAHNADGFDRFVWERLGWPAVRWIDTVLLARLAGLPASLDDLASSLLGQAKDRAGRTLTLSLSASGANGGLPQVTDEIRTRVTTYCRHDVALLSRVWQAELGAVFDVEHDVRRLDRDINDRGFLFDATLAAAVIELEARAVQELRAQAPVEPSVLLSPAKLIGWLAGAGYPVENIQKETLKALLGDPQLPQEVRRVVLARVGSSGIAGHKLRAALRRLGPDGRLRDTLVYHGAHTGRWSGRGFQPQNLPRMGKLEVDAAIELVKARDFRGLQSLAIAANQTPLEVLAALVRPCVVAPAGRLLGIVDFSSIEARTLLWLAGDEDGLALYRQGKDAYKVMAARLFQVPEAEVIAEQRRVGKSVILGCGYQMGPGRFRDYAEAMGVDWATMPMRPEEAVETWRDAHVSIAGVAGRTPGGSTNRRDGLWQLYEEAARRAVGGETTEIGAVTWMPKGDHIACRLPSGRQMIYPQARVENTRTQWGGVRPTLVYGRGGARVSSYGGKLVENVTQAVARDLLAHVLVELDREKYIIVLHVHDEVVVELEDEAGLEGVKKRMTTAPGWADGLPLAVEGHVAPRYTK